MEYDIVKSINGIPIRLTHERWFHITENHDDIAGYYDDILDIVENPDYIIKGYNNALIALRLLKENKFLSVVYKETSTDDGFIVTAYFTSRIKLENEEIVWKRQQ
jgi:hypothetical protein